jgi:sodium/potassium-transporting ATPase subunit alpha
MKARLFAAEKNLLNIHRRCKGDASETGLVQFAQSIHDLDELRKKYPTHSFASDTGKPVDVLIPFNSEYKFNLFVRDMGEELCVFMKGAPEKILKRCSKILVGNQEVDFTDELRKEISDAQASFGNLGERVLAFAKRSLPASKFNKSSYKFDVKGWKSWGLNPESQYSDYENQDGTWPMHNLTLVGVVSLNDPPRLKVDLSVNKCRSAGIKVIMVTGDQPATAGAIANKVNILKHPKKEFNYMHKELGLSEEDAWAQSTGVVVHGDLLAKKHLEQENLDDSDPKKGDFLRDWISKPEVVFARTTPSQKLLIVKACQDVDNVVAVTGDGVNDSPAIK